MKKFVIIILTLVFMVSPASAVIDLTPVFDMIITSLQILVVAMLAFLAVVFAFKKMIQLFNLSELGYKTKGRAREIKSKINSKTAPIKSFLDTNSKKTVTLKGSKPQTQRVKKALKSTKSKKAVAKPKASLYDRKPTANTNTKKSSSSKRRTKFTGFKNSKSSKIVKKDFMSKKYKETFKTDHKNGKRFQTKSNKKPKINPYKKQLTMNFEDKKTSSFSHKSSKKFTKEDKKTIANNVRKINRELRINPYKK